MVNRQDLRDPGCAIVRDVYLVVLLGGAGMAAGHIHTAENIHAGVEHSLHLLKTDYLEQGTDDLS